MKKSLPLATILINNYNYGRFLRAAIDSALNQSYPNIEVIVVDDGSTDNSREIIASYGDRIISILKENGGQASAFNAGFAASKGEWILFLDSDDLFRPKKVECVCEMAAQYPSAGMIAHNLEYCTADETPLDFLPTTILRRGLVDDRQKTQHGKLTTYLPATSGLCIRRDVLTQLLPMPEEIRVCADNYLKWVVLSLAIVLSAPEVLAKQRIHGDNLYTLANEDPGQAARLRCAVVNATVAFHLKREHPILSKLAWKMYGRILYQVKACRSEASRAIENEIRTRYSVIDWNLSSIYYVGGAFIMSLVRHLLRVSPNA